MRRDLTLEDRDEIMKALTDGDRIKATSIYMSITEAGLAEAQYFIKELSTDMNARQTLKASVKSSKRSWLKLFKGKD